MTLEREFTWTGPTQWGKEKSPLPPLAPELMSALLDNITARVAVVGRDHCFIYANREALEFYGRPAEQVIGQHLSKVLGEVAYSGYLPWAERLFNGDTLRWQGWVEYPTRGRRFLQETMVPFAPADAEVQGIVVFGRDHTELKLREEQLAEQLSQLQASEALKAAIVDHALAALISTDGQGRIVEFNPAAETMFGRQRADVMGQPVSEVIMPERYRALHEAGIRRMEQGGEARVLGKRMELHALRADGSEFPIEMVLWRTNVGGTTYYTASLVDVTERYNAAQQIERQRDALRQSEKLTAMGSLLAGVAHELNNPLAIVMGRASLLEEKCDDPAIRLDVQRIREAAERCGRIVRTFLNMARSKPATRESVSLNDLTRAAAEMLSYSYRSHGVEMKLNLIDDLPSVKADGDQIGQIVLNLLVNAQQALAGGVGAAGGERRVLLETGVEARRENREPRVWLRVSDNGPGVPPELRDKLFEPFFTTKPEGLGTGLGLAVSRSLARDHGGDLTLEPTAHEGGASFRLNLPISGEPVQESGPVPLQGADVFQSRLLVVDDEPEIAELMRDMLEGAGYEVATAESGAVAMALLETARFDAIVSDLHMPDMDGATLWREIEQHHPALAHRMLFVTGDTLSPGAREFLRKAHCTGLDKPFSRADLLAAVALLLE
ncbi:MAG: PAS domain S-box protein [Cytophagales bacterium]|nr:PAS domain S-box protein [Rhizobacter sp.]